MARPRKDPAERRDDLLAIRLTTAERTELERSAVAHGVTVAGFMRSRALGYRLPPLSAEHQAMASLAAALMPIGVNLNQIARATNAGRHLPSIVEELAARIAALLDGFYGSGTDSGRAQL